jgi:hypothetical protein
MQDKPQQRQLCEGLRANDLKGFVREVFTLDQYRSKMGEDQDVIVVGFTVNEKEPAADLMEFIEKGYPFVLDADVSSGEERDGKYQVFVEIERNKQFPSKLKDLLSGVSRLTDNYDWRFRYYKDVTGHHFSEDAILENVPLDLKDYETKMLEIKTNVVAEFFNQGATSIMVDNDDTIIAQKAYSGPIAMELLALGDYEEVKDSLPGGLMLDESSQSQVAFLEKYLGNYEINKINGKFLIRNGDRGMIVKKDRW